MLVYPAEQLSLDASVVTIGAFDGVHLGHQALIRQARTRAWSLGIPLVIYTFDPPPRVFFQAVPLLTPAEEKIRRLSAFQPDYIIMAHFDASYAQRRARDFIRELFKLGAYEIWTGNDFHFGYKREGDVELLKQYFIVESLHTVCCPQAKRISSSRIRELLTQQRWEEASRLMGWQAEVQPTMQANT